MDSFMTVLGIDIGGTKLAVGIVETSGNILARGEVPTLAAEGPERVLNRLIQLAEDVLAAPRVSSESWLPDRPSPAECVRPWRLGGRAVSVQRKSSLRSMWYVWPRRKM